MGEITRKKKKINWFMVMLLVPALAMLTVTIIIPVFVVVGMSFFHYNLLDMGNIKWNHFSNYKAVFSDAEFIRSTSLAYLQNQSIKKRLSVWSNT